MENGKFTEEDFHAVGWYFEAYFIEVLNKEYDLEDAINDLRGLIGSKYDSRVIQESENK